MRIAKTYTSIVNPSEHSGRLLPNKASVTIPIAPRHNGSDALWKVSLEESRDNRTHVHADHEPGNRAIPPRGTQLLRMKSHSLMIFALAQSRRRDLALFEICSLTMKGRSRDDGG